MRALVFVPDQDSPGKRDVTGAFLPEARAWCRYHRVDESAILRFPAGLPLEQRRAWCTTALKGKLRPTSSAALRLDVVAFFCHGWPQGIQAGFLRQHAMLLGRALATVTKPSCHVLLYACEAGSSLGNDDDTTAGPGGDGGFADGLRDTCEVMGQRVTVLAHTTTGHSTWNPHVRRFAPDCAGKGGEWYVAPRSPLWPLWVAALRDPKSTLRYRFFSMTTDEIANELRGTPGPLVA